MKQPELHYISSELAGDQFIRTAIQCHAVLDYLHLRDKTVPARRIAEAAAILLAGGVPAAKLVVNDRVDVAVAVGAANVQLAWHSLPAGLVKDRWPELRVGCSVHSPQEAAEAFLQGADYVLFGHVFATASKRGQPGRGLAALGEAARCSPGPVIAIGGIEPGHAPALLAHDAAGWAVMSGIGAAEDPLAAALSYRQAAEQAYPHHSGKGGDEH